MAAAVLIATVAAVTIGCSVGSRPGDPARLPGDDPRVAGCGIPTSNMWMVFAMARASDFSRHFPGWTRGAEELEVPDPALVIITNGYPAMRGTALAYDMCIAIGPPADARIHHYEGTRFDAVRPELGGPLVPMP